MPVQLRPMAALLVALVGLSPAAVVAGASGLSLTVLMTRRLAPQG